MASPIDRLPPEVLSYIFVTLVESSRYAASVGDQSYGRTGYPLCLSSVCLHWRQVAINTPVLWSFLDLRTSDSSVKKLRYLDMCYQRSTNAPLSVRLGNSNDICKDDTVHEQLDSLFSSYAPRLYSLAVVYGCPGFAKALLSTLHARRAAGQVRKLALHASGWDDPILADGSLQQDALDELLEPLRSLRLECVAFDWDTIRCRNLVELQISNLRTIANPSSSQLVSFLNANPTIRKLIISDLRLAVYEPSSPPIKLPELQDLSLSLGLEFAEWFFTLLTPGTRDITLQFQCHVPEPHKAQGLINALCQFLQRSRIVKLLVSGSHSIPFSNIVVYLPHLEILRTSSPNSGYDFSNLNMPTKLLPKLHTVELLEGTTRDVESGLRTILSLPSVKQILFPFFRRAFDVDGLATMSTDKVREWMRGQGVTANLRVSPELRFRSDPSPFL